MNQISAPQTYYPVILKDSQPVEQKRKKRRSRLLAFIMCFGPICALLTAGLIIALLLLIKKTENEPAKATEMSTTANQNGTFGTTVMNNSSTLPTTTTTSITATLTSTITSTTTTSNTCYLRWNSTLVTVAGYSNGTPSASPVGLDHPRGIFIDQNNNLYIADNFNNRIQKWPQNAAFGTTVAGDANGTAGWLNGRIYYPTSVYVDSSLTMYILDNGNSRVLQWPSGATVGTVIAGTTGFNINSTYSFGQAWSMAVDTTNSKVYIADLWYPRILVWPFSANASSSIIPLAEAVGVTKDSSGNLYVTAQNLNTVTRILAGASSGTTYLTAGLSGPWIPRFDQYGNFYVPNIVSGTIVMFCTGFTANANSSIVASGLNQPVDLAFDSQMNMYVSEYGNHRVVKLAKLP